MPRCPDPQCGGYLIYEPELVGIAARVKCIACGWMHSDPRFRKEQPSYFPRADRIGWQMEHPGYDLYFPRSGAAQLGISVSFFKESVRKRFFSAGYMGARNDRLQHTGVAAVVGREETLTASQVNDESLNTLVLSLDDLSSDRDI